MSDLADRLDALLPQTQCMRCKYPDCRGYAEALARGEADIDRCPPGGDVTAQALAALLQRPAKPVDTATYGNVPDGGLVALIDEDACIGCFKCVPACPVDAIVGAPKRMHTVITAECSGCELCLPACPVDCISLPPRAATLPAPAAQAGRWRERYRAHLARRAAREAARRQRRESALQARARSFDINAAIARARARRSGSNGEKV